MWLLGKFFEAERRFFAVAAWLVVCCPPLLSGELSRQCQFAGHDTSYVRFSRDFIAMVMVVCVVRRQPDILPDPNHTKTKNLFDSTQETAIRHQTCQLSRPPDRPDRRESSSTSNHPISQSVPCCARLRSAQHMSDKVLCRAADANCIWTKRSGTDKMMQKLGCC